METAPVFLSPDYLLLKRAYERLKALSQGEDGELLQLLGQRLNELYPTDPKLAPLTSRVFLCEQCGGSLQVVRVAGICETIAVDQHTGQLIWASELLTNEGAPSFEVQDSYVTCIRCHKESTRVCYNRQQARLAVVCCVCDADFFLEEGGEVLEDARGYPRPVCSPPCKESLQSEL